MWSHVVGLGLGFGPIFRDHVGIARVDCILEIRVEFEFIYSTIQVLVGIGKDIPRRHCKTGHISHLTQPTYARTQQTASGHI